MQILRSLAAAALLVSFVGCTSGPPIVNDAVTQSGHTYLRLPHEGLDAGAVVIAYHKLGKDPDILIHGQKIQAWAGPPASGKSVNLSSWFQKQYELDLTGEAQRLLKGTIGLSNVVSVAATLTNTHIEEYDRDQILTAAGKGVPEGYQEVIKRSELDGNACSILMSVVVGDVVYDFRGANGGSISLTADKWKEANATLKAGGGSQATNSYNGKKVTVAYKDNLKVVADIKDGPTKRGKAPENPSGPPKKPLPPDDWNEPQWQTARINISWVFGDKGAHEKYAANLGAGKFEALLRAQSGNKGAYQSISEYGAARTALYLTSIGQ